MKTKATQSKKPRVKVRDLKPKKDAKGGSKVEIRTGRRRFLTKSAGAEACVKHAALSLPSSRGGSAGEGRVNAGHHGPRIREDNEPGFEFDGAQHIHPPLAPRAW